ncbi:MAG: O-antigen ligase [Saprospiraceae bacterium]|jgi:O-antigen ligase|tara:strand:+ start:2193 stop:3644 length:1452 start_codon:yes stop_codon:yes gene_type:complete
MLVNKVYKHSKEAKKIFYAFAGIIILCTIIALVKEMYLLAAAPLAVLALVAIIKDYRILYYGFWISLPFSIEFYFGSIGMDLPTEPMMLGLTGIAVMVFLQKIGQVSLRHLFHPISMFLILHLVWMFFTTLFSQSPVVSYKFFLAKMWYVIPFFFFSFHMVKDILIVERIIKIMAIFLTIAVLIVLTRHALDGFTFKGSHHVVRPIFRNHVSYSSILVIVLPFLWAFRSNIEKLKYRRLMSLVIFLFVVATYFSYTRAAQGCIIIAIGGYFIIKFRLAKIAILSACILTSLLVAHLVTNNKYLDYAPNFEKTIAHTSFDNILEATMKLEDISTMERVYRWVAGSQMIKERPILGHGPGSFYNHYTKYTVSSFETYVSDNPEKSGIHSYYLMTFVEQGFIGFLIFLGLIFSIILHGEKVYHNLTRSKTKNYVMAATLSIIVICTLCLINDLIEIDKVGPFFFLCAAIIVIFDLQSKKPIPYDTK